MPAEIIGNKYLVPYVRLFPIWRFGPLYSRLDGYYIRDGWKPDRYGTWTCGSREEADARIARRPH